MQQKQKEIHRGMLEDNQSKTALMPRPKPKPTSPTTQSLEPGLEGLEELELEHEALPPNSWNLKDNPSNPKNVFMTGINQETLKQFGILNSE